MRVRRPEATAIAVDTNLTKLIVASLVSNNPTTAIELPALIATVHAAVLGIDSIRTAPGGGCAPTLPAS